MNTNLLAKKRLKGAKFSVDLLEKFLNENG
jgi:hypothetical protein